MFPLLGRLLQTKAANRIESKLTPSTDQTSTAKPVMGAMLEGCKFSKYSGFCGKRSRCVATGTTVGGGRRQGSGGVRAYKQLALALAYTWYASGEDRRVYGGVYHSAESTVESMSSLQRSQQSCRYSTVVYCRVYCRVCCRVESTVESTVDSTASATLESTVESTAESTVRAI